MGVAVGDVSVRMSSDAQSATGANTSGGATYFGNSGGDSSFLSLPTSPNSLMIIGVVLIVAIIIWKA